jgi:hypothetical protein
MYEAIVASGDAGRKDEKRPATRKDVKKFIDYCVTLRAFWIHYQTMFDGSDLKRELLHHDLFHLRSPSDSPADHPAGGDEEPSTSSEAAPHPALPCAEIASLRETC